MKSRTSPLIEMQTHRSAIQGRGTALPVLCLVLMLVGGCAAVGPDYMRPDTPVPESWSTSFEQNLSAGMADPEELARWWSSLNDPLLTSLIERAVAGNHDLRRARARIREARARRNIAAAALFPSVDAAASMTKRRSSEDTGGGGETDLYSAGFDAAWELDLFGGVRRSVEAAGAELEASEEDLRSVLVSLIAETALNYVDLRSFQNRLSLASTNLASQEETYTITRWRFLAGLTTELDVEQARYSMEQTRAQIPLLQIGFEQAGYRIAVILGQNPGTLRDELTEEQPVPMPPDTVAVGIPADTLRMRPDIRRAERELAAQTARVGEATADLYPKFRLSGSIGLEALSFDNLFRASSRTYGISPAFSWNVFDAGRIRENIEVQNALQEQAMIQYEQAVLAALEEVENALTAYARDQVRRGSLTEASQAAQRAEELARSQYASGLIDFQAVLTAQRSLLSLQDQLASSRADVTSDLISLYKALGGGWSSQAAKEGL
ncbi:MAG: efflux transporter outer membrane subunit [Nitrospiraceae bacterium]|nr:MAG: efflux transporter outer membrane subunit [Nitrospiraceae bacterium]